MTPVNNNHLLILGPGYSATAVARKCLAAGWQVSATFRSEEGREKLTALTQHSAGPDTTAPGAIGVSPVPFGTLPDMRTVTHLLVSVPPGGDGDPALKAYGPHMSAMPDLKWVGYLSSTNVYGNHDGAWVDETTPPAPGLDRGRRRLAAEQAWQAQCSNVQTPLHIFRLAGIYGPGRNAVRSILDSRARRIIKKGQVFSRIHVDDIAQTVVTAMGSGLADNIFNLADDRPCPPQDIIEKAAKRLRMPLPPGVPYDKAALSPMARSFYEENKRVRNNKIKATLGIELRYPDFTSALEDLIASEKD